ncbi:MAG: hypothetical protein PVF34_13550 [Gammaproteobacteria bacterium]
MSQHKLPQSWWFWGAIILAAHFLAGLVPVMLLNGKIVNHVLTPVVQYLGMFKLIWPEQPLGSLQFLATKSLFAFAHNDPRSGLNLWTLEYDSYTVLVYIGVSVMLGWAISHYQQARALVSPAALVLSLTGGIFLSMSISYMTVIDHCSGATWVGFVTLYGLGFDEFELYYAYQITCAVIGIVLISAGLWLFRGKNPVPA